MECCLFNQIKLKHFFYPCLSDASDGKESACNVGDTGSKAGSGRCAGEGNGYPSSILAWRIPEQRSLEGYNPWSCKGSVRHN